MIFTNFAFIYVHRWREIVGYFTFLASIKYRKHIFLMFCYKKWYTSFRCARLNRKSFSIGITLHSMSIIQWFYVFASLRIIFCAIIREEEKYISGHYLISMSFCIPTLNNTTNKKDLSREKERYLNGQLHQKVGNYV